jgi:hypothetical protein
MGKNSSIRIAFALDFLVTCFVGGELFYDLGQQGAFGSGGARDVYNFNFRNGEKGVVQREDLRFSPDKYWIKCEDGRQISHGTFSSDGGGAVLVWGNYCEIMGDETGLQWRRVELYDF